MSNILNHNRILIDFILAGVYYLWGAEVWCIVSVTMAVVCLLIHRKVIARVAAIYDRRRYERMEKYMEN